jgi:DNA-binding XRE family transcriptional regulator
MNYKIIKDPTRLKIFHESTKRRVLVGELIYHSNQDIYELIYDNTYVHSKNAIPISPEFTLFKLNHRTTKGKIFPFLLDRIPDKSNPAYTDYCKSQGISPNETNPIILLGTIGQRGPSSFIFEPVYHTTFELSDFKKLREQLNITQHDFATAFGINKTTLQRIEAGVSKDTNTIRFIEIILTFPQVALWQLKQSGQTVHKDVLIKLSRYFQG